MRYLLSFLFVLLSSTGVMAAQYDTGASDTEIKIGNTAPYTGPVAAAHTIAVAEKAYFDKINAEGGVNGRKINFISLDDAYSPPKNVEQTRALVQKDKVFLIFNPVGTQNTLATRQYLNQQKIPQILVATGSPEFFQPKKFPWSTGFLPGYIDEGKVYGAYVAKNFPNAKVGVLYQNDSLGKAYYEGFKQGMGGKAKNIVRAESYELINANLDAQVNNLKASGATVLFNAAIAKFAAQSIRKMDELNWHPALFLNFINANREVVFKPVGYDKIQGAITARYLKDPYEYKSNSANKDDQVFANYYETMKKYGPSISPEDQYAVYGYVAAQTLVDILKRCGNDLTRKNALKQATNINLAAEMLLPGIEITVQPNNYYPFRKLQIMRFEGEHWVPFGDLVDVNTLNVPVAPDTNKKAS